MNAVLTRMSYKSEFARASLCTCRTKNVAYALLQNDRSPQNTLTIPWKCHFDATCPYKQKMKNIKITDCSSLSSSLTHLY